VKNTAKFILLSIFSALFYLILSTSSDASVTNDKANNGTENSQKEKIKSIDSDHFVCLSSRSISFTKNNPGSTFKVVSNTLFIHTIAIERLFNTTFSVYKFYAINGIVRFTQTDIIFPFHYFW
jgi:hypothetical protein